MTALTIEVTQDDIAEGERKDCNRCPVALAMLRAMPGTEVDVVGAGAWILPPDTPPDQRWQAWKKVILPDEARLLISRFDRGHAVSPLTFDLEVPDALVGINA